MKGLSSGDLAKIYDCTAKNIRYILKKMGVKMRNPKKALSKEEKDKIIELHHAGYLVMDISREIGRNHKSVRRVLKNHDLDIIVQRKHLSKSEIKKAKELYLNGQSRNIIGERFGVAGSTISRTLKREGIKMRDRSHCNRKYDINENYFDNIDTEEKAYIVGFLFADGCNYPPTNQVSISLHKQDIDILKVIRNELETDIPFYYPPETNQVTLTVTNEHISSKLNDLGVVQNKTFKLTFPDWLDEELYSHFIRGHFDGDGHIGYYIKNEKIDGNIYITSNYKFCKSLKEIFKNELNIEFSFFRKKDTRASFALETGGNIQVKRFCDYLWKDANIYLERKYNIYQDFSKLYNG
jgi:transposase-like protein